MGNQYEYYDIDLMDMKWKLLTSYHYNIKNNAYLISEYGDIYNLRTKKIMKQERIPNNKGNIYSRIRLCTDDNSFVKVSIHRLVAFYYLPPNDDPEHKTFVDHKNGDKLKNHYSNLEWVTPTENAIRAYKMGLSTLKGETHHFSVYSDDQIHAICRLLELGYTATQILQELNLIDFTGYRYYYQHPEYDRLKGYITKLRSRTFRKDIVLQYNF